MKASASLCIGDSESLQLMMLLTYSCGLLQVYVTLYALRMTTIA